MRPNAGFAAQLKAWEVRLKAGEVRLEAGEEQVERKAGEAVS